MVFIGINLFMWFIFLFFKIENYFSFKIVEVKYDCFFYSNFKILNLRSKWGKCFFWFRLEIFKY